MMLRFFQEKYFEQKNYYDAIFAWPPANNKNVSVHLRYFGLSRITTVEKQTLHKMFDGPGLPRQKLIFRRILGVILSKFWENFSDLCEILGGF